VGAGWLALIAGAVEAAPGDELPLAAWVAAGEAVARAAAPEAKSAVSPHAASTPLTIRPPITKKSSLRDNIMFITSLWLLHSLLLVFLKFFDSLLIKGELRMLKFSYRLN
jgi:hypothetical protein